MVGKGLVVCIELVVTQHSYIHIQEGLFSVSHEYHMILDLATDGRRMSGCREKQTGPRRKV